MPNLPFKEQVAVWRAPTSGGKNTYVFSHNLMVHLQPLDTEYQLTDTAFSRTLRGFAESGANIRKDDKLVWDGKDYKVSAVSNYKFGYLKHLEFVIEELVGNK